MTTVAATRDDGSTEPSSETRPPTSSHEARPPDAQASDVDCAPDRRAADERKIDGSAESAISEASTALPQALKIVGTVAAPPHC